MDVDQGRAFGQWGDPTSRLIYHDVMPALLTGIDRWTYTLDLGGGNGLLKQWLPYSHSVDLDASKEPDEVADVLTYTPLTTGYRLVAMRYLLHYLTDEQVRHLLAHVATYHDGPVLLIQFINDGYDLELKRRNSVNEVKHFRSEQDLGPLLDPWTVRRRVAVQYDVGADFYANRLANPHGVPHGETVVSYLLEKG